MENAQYLAMGKVVGTHGIRGELKILSHADSLDPFAPEKRLILSGKGRHRGVFSVASSRPHKRVILLALEGIHTIEDAEPWVGCEILVPREALPALEEGDYYWFEIIGMQVNGVDGRGLGRVEAVFPTGSNDVYVVRDGKKEILIPAIDSVVVDIDKESRVMQVDLPEGLED